MIQNIKKKEKTSSKVTLFSHMIEHARAPQHFDDSENWDQTTRLGRVSPLSDRSATRLQMLPPTAFRSLGGYLDYTNWPERQRFIELDTAIQSGIGQSCEIPASSPAAQTTIVDAPYDVPPDLESGIIPSEETHSFCENRGHWNSLSRTLGQSNGNAPTSSTAEWTSRLVNPERLDLISKAGEAEASLCEVGATTPAVSPGDNTHNLPGSAERLTRVDGLTLKIWREELKQLRNAGMSAYAIARRLGMPSQIIRRELRKSDPLGEVIPPALSFRGQRALAIVQHERPKGSSWDKCSAGNVNLE